MMTKDYRVRALLDLDAAELQRRTLDKLDGKEPLTAKATRQAQEIATLRADLAEARQQLAELRAKYEVGYRGLPPIGAEARAAQRERDAQQLDDAAGELYGTSRANTNIARILREEAAKMRAARTPQEPTGTED